MPRHAVLVLAGLIAVTACSSGSENSTRVSTTPPLVITSTGSSTDVPTKAIDIAEPVARNQAPAIEAPAADALSAEAQAAPSTAAPSTAAPSTAAPSASADPTIGRPYDVFVPASYDDSSPMPLVILLHGYAATGAIQEAYFQLQPLAESRGFLYVHPDGLTDVRNNHFWNATDACCDLGGNGVDDVAYLTAVIDKVEADYSVDPKRIYLVGHSNGGFMSYRMACERSDLVAAIASVAGATFADPATCKPSSPVSVLQVHGTSDGTISYTGGSILGHVYPSAQGSISTWAAYDGCGGTLEPSGETLDLEATIDGEESTVSAFSGCPAGVSVELWSVDGGSHIPRVSTTFSGEIIDFLLAHPKP